MKNPTIIAALIVASSIIGSALILKNEMKETNERLKEIHISFRLANGITGSFE